MLHCTKATLSLPDYEIAVRLRPRQGVALAWGADLAGLARVEWGAPAPEGGGVAVDPCDHR